MLGCCAVWFRPSVVHPLVRLCVLMCSAEAVLQKQLCRISSAESVLQKQVCRRNSAEAILQKQFCRSSSAEGVLQQQVCRSNPAQAVLQKQFCRSSSSYVKPHDPHIWSRKPGWHVLLLLWCIWNENRVGHYILLLLTMLYYMLLHLRTLYYAVRRFRPID